MHKWTNQLTLKSTITPVKALMIMPKFSWNVYRENTDYRYGPLDTTAVRTSQTYEPSIFLKWKMSRMRNMDFSLLSVKKSLSYQMSLLKMSSTYNDSLHLFLQKP
jgi:hypothetical protein